MVLNPLTYVRLYMRGRAAARYAARYGIPGMNFDHFGRRLGLRLRRIGLRVKRLYKRGYVWHHEAQIDNQLDILRYFNSRYQEGREAVKFYKKHPTFSVKMMTMTGRLFFFMDDILFDDSYLRSEKYHQKILSLWQKNRKNRAVGSLRFRSNHFYLKGVREGLKGAGR